MNDWWIFPSEFQMIIMAVSESRNHCTDYLH